MKAMMYMLGKDEPVAVFDHIEIVTMNDNHTAAPKRVFFRSQKLSAGRTMVEMQRDNSMTLKFDDGRQCSVLLQHSSMDEEGRAVGVMRVLGDLEEA